MCCFSLCVIGYGFRFISFSLFLFVDFDFARRRFLCVTHTQTKTNTQIHTIARTTTTNCQYQNWLRHCELWRASSREQTSERDRDRASKVTTYFFWKKNLCSMNKYVKWTVCVCERQREGKTHIFVYLFCGPQRLELIQCLCRVYLNWFDFFILLFVLLQRVYLWCACDWSHIVNNGIVISKSNSGNSYNNNNNSGSQRWKEANILANAKQIKDTFCVWMCVWLRVWLVLCACAEENKERKESVREINSDEKKGSHCV